MRNKTLTAIFALFLGIFGVHRFYLGQVGLGVLYLLFFWTSIPFWLGIIDALVFFGMSEEEFDVRYNNVRGSHYHRSYSPNQRQRPGHQRYDKDVDPNQYKTHETSERRQQSTINRPPRPAGKTRRSSTVKPSNSDDKKEGIKYFKAFNYDEAIKHFEKALEIDPNDIAVHFNLGCAYSLTEQKEKAFVHIHKAVELGFNDYERIHTHESLAFMRIQPEYVAFKDADYKTLPEMVQKEKTTPSDDETIAPDHISPPLLDTAQEDTILKEIKRLENLKELGVLNDEEFQEQKAKIERPR